MQTNALAPIFYGDELDQSTFLGNTYIPPRLPAETFPYHQRIQENQERAEKTSPRIPKGCTVFQFLDICENKVHHKLGEWHQVAPGEFERLFTKVINAGYGTRTGGCYMNGINKVLEDGDTIQMGIWKKGKFVKTLRVQQNRWYMIANRSQTNEEFEAAVRYELAYNPGGVQYGMVTTQSRLGYLEADDAPYVVEHNSSPAGIAHGFPLAGYDEPNLPGLIISPGSSGENFGDKGVVYLNGHDLRKGFTPLGFTINILNNNS